MIVEALGDILAADSYITSRLATYAGNPAIFSIDPAPADADNPVIVLRGPVTGTRAGTRDSKGTESIYDIAIYDDKTMSETTLREITWRVWEQIERADLTVEGYESIGVVATPPRRAPDPDGFPGYIISARVHVLKE